MQGITVITYQEYSAQNLQFTLLYLLIIHLQYSQDLELANIIRDLTKEQAVPQYPKQYNDILLV